MEQFVKQAVNVIRQRYDEPLRLDDLAQVAMTSKFHFLRTFRCFTGVTPGRFLCAVRLHEAKRLLGTTSLKVIDVSVLVGYSSAGTFTRRFTESVGLPPNQYRRMARGEQISKSKDFAGESTRPVSGTIGGTIRTTNMPQSAIYLGVFESRITQGQPAACVSVPDCRPFRMAVPTGTWYLNVAAVAATSRTHDGVSCDVPLLVDTIGPVLVRPHTDVCLDVKLHPESWTEPPMLFALPGLDSPLLSATGSA